MNTAELEKKFKALEKSPTPSIALKRSKRLGTFIIQNTGKADIYMAPRTDVYLRHVLQAKHVQVLQSTLSRLAV
ncbi:hypothetical protein [Acinetobacter puyangensis]|uniref:hypothetical protein n=1 Tax=Acinetobacter puyangensis TaxID=1096779 RepID=UPI003A4DD149